MGVIEKIFKVLLTLVSLAIVILLNRVIHDKFSDLIEDLLAFETVVILLFALAFTSLGSLIYQFYSLVFIFKLKKQYTYRSPTEYLEYICIV